MIRLSLTSALLISALSPTVAYSACEIRDDSNALMMSTKSVSNDRDIAKTASNAVANFAIRPEICEEKDTVQRDATVVDLLGQTGLAASGLQLDFDSEASAITFGIDHDISKTSFTRFRENQLGLKLTLPFDGESKETSIISTRLSGDAEAKLSFSMVWGKPTFVPGSRKRSDDELIEIFVAAKEACKSANQAEDGSEPQNCKTNDGAFEYIDPQVVQDIADEHQKNKSALWFWGVEAGIGMKEEQYFDRSNLSMIEQGTTPYSISTTLGVLPNRRGLFLGAGALHKRTYKQGDSETVCLPGSAMDELNCQTGSFVPLEKNIDTSAYALARFQDVNDRFGLEIRAGYDFEDDVFGVEAPIYLFKNEKGNLSSGVKVSWQDDEDSDVEFGFFIGAPFNFFSGD